MFRWAGLFTNTITAKHRVVKFQEIDGYGEKDSEKRRVCRLVWRLSTAGAEPDDVELNSTQTQLTFISINNDTNKLDTVISKN